MRYGLSVYDVSGPDLVALAVAAEAANFDSLWLGEHLFLPVGYETVHPTRDEAEEHAARIVRPETSLLDPLVALGAAAARTERIGLGTAVYLLALRHPLAAARATLTLQDLAQGRLRLGVGTGWLREEFDALGIPFADRARRLEECIDILRHAWAGGVFEHHGTHFDFGPVELASRPVSVPLVLGGNTPPALRRAARWADGWFASANPTPSEAVELVAALRAACDDAGRKEPIDVYVRVSPPTADLSVYEDAGVSCVVFWAHELCPTRAGGWAGLSDAAAALGVPAAGAPVPAGDAAGR